MSGNYREKQERLEGHDYVGRLHNCNAELKQNGPVFLNPRVFVGAHLLSTQRQRLQMQHNRPDKYTDAANTQTCAESRFNKAQKAPRRG